MAETKRKELEQGRARFAFSCAEKGASLGKAKEYKSYVKKLPMLIKTNGLGATLAFVYSKGAKNGVIQEQTAYGLIYSQIENWLLEDDKSLISFEKGKLISKLLECDSASYRAITVEILAFLSWTRRFAEGLIAGETDGN